MDAKDKIRVPVCVTYYPDERRMVVTKEVEVTKLELGDALIHLLGIDKALHLSREDA